MAKTPEQIASAQERRRFYQRKRRERMAVDPDYAESERAKKRAQKKAARTRANALKPPKARPIRIEGGLAFVPLTQGLEAIIDATDAHLVDQQNWYALRRANGLVYAVAKKRVGSKQTMIHMHRVVLGEDDKPLVDHIDGNGLNNRRGNLRGASRLQNFANSRAKINGRSAYKGAFWRPAARRWHSQIQVDGKTRFLGSFATEEEAARAYDAAAQRVHGEFARLNFPKEPNPLYRLALENTDDR